jgi:vacuolar-type H+-ATPase subunit H
LLKQAIDALKKAETDAEQVIQSAKRHSAEIRKQAEEEKALAISKAVQAAELESASLASKFESEAEAIKADASRKAVDESKLVEKSANANRARALNKAVERIVRRNGHR